MGKPARYATGTNVPADRSRLEIERLLKRHGASGFMSGWDESSCAEQIMCKLEGRMLKFTVETPQPSQFMQTEKGRQRTTNAAEKACEAEHKRRWRALLLLVKAKLEAIAAELSTVEHEFLADIYLPDGNTVGQWIGKQLDEVYEQGGMPPLLPGRTS